MPAIPSIPVRPAGRMPVLGFGTFQLKDDACRQAVATALEVGYRHLDTADVYGNQRPVGEGIRDSGVPRSELYLTTKVWRDNLAHDDVLRSCDKSLAELGVDQLDLLLVHWPNNDIPMEATFRAMARLIDDGKIAACGVSNFTVERLERALALDLVPIAVNQVEYHPLLNQKDLDDFCKSRNVIVEAYSPLVQGQVKDDDLLKRVGAAHGKSPAQVALRWLLDRDIVVIPKASSRARMVENMEIFDFQLTPEEFEQIDTRDVWKRLINWEVAEFDR